MKNLNRDLSVNRTASLISIQTWTLFGVFGISLFLITIVSYSAWVSEDAFITLRYVSNTLKGYGAVFNLGERVQGFTHPLWYLILLSASFFSDNGILVAVGCGLVLTLSLSIFLGLTLCKSTKASIDALIIFALACSVFISSDSWISFQTAGLENALSNFIIAICITESFLHRGNRPGRLLLLLGLLCLSRPDMILFSIPFGLLTIPHLRSFRTVISSISAIIPCIAWIIFAWIYYGDPLPNTGMAKLGNYPSRIHSIRQGAIYVCDWCVSEPIAAASVVIVIVSAISIRRNCVTLAVVAGITLHVAWVVWIGGDFMRGRFLVPALTASVVLGSLILAHQCQEMPSAMPHPLWLSIVWVFIVSTLFHGISNAFDWNTTPRAGIVSERKFYPGYSLKSYLVRGHLSNPYIDLKLADELRAYANQCGPFAIHMRNPGTIGYLAGPEVTIIDTLGLTDRYIAKLSRIYLTNPIPRPGHPDKYIPVRYLASRGDVSLIPSWVERIRQRDCSLRIGTLRYENSTKFWSPDGTLIDFDIVEAEKAEGIQKPQ